jgi:hypothetical protein
LVMICLLLVTMGAPVEQRWSLLLPSHSIPCDQPAPRTLSRHNPPLRFAPEAAAIRHFRPHSPQSLSRPLDKLRVTALYTLLRFAIEHPGQAQQHRRGARRALGRAVSNAVAVLAQVSAVQGNMLHLYNRHTVTSFFVNAGQERSKYRPPPAPSGIHSMQPEPIPLFSLTLRKLAGFDPAARVASCSRPAAAR